MSFTVSPERVLNFFLEREVGNKECKRRKNNERKAQARYSLIFAQHDTEANVLRAMLSGDHEAAFFGRGEERLEVGTL